MTGIVAVIDALQVTQGGAGGGGTTFPSAIPQANYAFDFTASSNNLPANATLTRSSSGVFQTQTGLYATAANDQPRIDFGMNPFGLAFSRGLMIEGASSLLLTRTDQLNQSPPWGVQNGTVTANVQPGPFGTTSMEQITNGAATFNEVFEAVPGGVTAGATYALTAHLKGGQTDGLMAVQFTEFGAGWGGAAFNLGNGTINSFLSNNWTVQQATIEPMADGTIWRVSIVATTPATKATNADTYVLHSGTSSAGVGSTVVSTAGAIGFASDFQVEAGTIATSYLPAPADTPVARAADSVTVNLVANAVTLQASGTTTATFVAQGPHGFATGNSVVIAGATPSGFNGTFTITVTSPTQFTYTLGGALTTVATGTITAALASAAYDILVSDTDGAEIRQNITVTSGAFVLTPRAGQTHVQKVAFWTHGILNTLQMNQLVPPAQLGGSAGQAIITPPLPGYGLVKEWTFGTGKTSNGTNSIAINNTTELLAEWRDHLFNTAPVDTRCYNIDANGWNLGIFNTGTSVLGQSFFGSINFTGLFGYFEIRAKLPPSGGCWSTFWLSGNFTDSLNNTNGGQQSQSEIDIMDAHFDGTTAAFKEVDFETRHTPNHTIINQTVDQAGVDLSADYHVYGLEWTSANQVQYYRDGVPIGSRFNYVWSNPSTPNAPPNIQVSVQDMAFFDGVQASTFIAASAGAFMNIDYIRVWQLGASETSTLLGAGAVPTGHDKSNFGWTLSFLDDFNGTLDTDGTLYLDRSKWTSGLPPVALGQDNGGAGSRRRPATKEQQLYVDKDWAGPTGAVSPAQRINPFSFNASIVTVQSGMIPAALQSAYGAAGAQVFYSGCITTCNKFAQLFGMFEARMQVPTTAIGATPMLFLLPQPATGADPYWPPAVHVSELMPFLHPSLASWHFQGDSRSGFQGFAAFPGTASVGDSMHIYTLIWDSTNLTWFLDGVQYQQQPTPASMRSRPMFMTFAVPIGGEWYRLEANYGVGNYAQLVTDVNANPGLMPFGTQVDWIRAYTPGPAPLQVSPDGSTIPPLAQLVDSSLTVWTVSGGVVARDGVADGTTSGVVLLLWFQGSIYQENGAGAWFIWSNNTWLSVPGDPRVGPVAPPQAQAAGFHTLLFSDDFNDPSTIDTTTTGAAGFKWYTDKAFGGTPTPAGDISVSGGVLTLTSNGGPNSGLNTFSVKGATGFQYRYGYLEASISFDPTLGPTAPGWPSVWGLAVEHMQGFNNTEWLEFDTFEAFTGGFAAYSGNYVGTVHDWEAGGTTNIQNSNNNTTTAVNWNQFQTVGGLWKPGVFQWYLNNTLLQTVTYSATGAPTPPDGPAGTYSIADSQHLPVILGSDGWPMKVDWVRVWGAP